MNDDELNRIWQKINRQDARLDKIEREMEDEQMQEAVKAGVRSAMSGKMVLPLGLFPKAVAILVAIVALAGGIKGLIQ